MNSRCAIAAWLECFQEKPSWCRNEQVCQGRKSVKRFERSNGLDTALYKTIPLYANSNFMDRCIVFFLCYYFIGVSDNKALDRIIV